MESIEELPDIDDRLALPEAGYEIIDGVVMFVAPADPPHAERHVTIAILVGTHVHPDYQVAAAPAVSVFPRRIDPVTGRRSLEQLTIEIVSTESMSHATTRAAKLAGRGVRRSFAIDIVRERVLEWSHELASWVVLDARGQIQDQTLAVPLQVGALLEAATTEDEVARALIAKRNPVIDLAITDEQRGRIRSKPDLSRLSCTNVGELFE